MDLIFFVERCQFIMDRLELAVLFHPEHKYRNLVNPLDYIFSPFLHHLDVLINQRLVCLATLEPHHSGFFEGILSKYKLFLQEVKADALVEIFLTHSALLREVLGSAAQVANQIDTVLDRQGPEDTTSHYECKQPEVGRKEREFTLTILEFDRMWTRLPKEIILQNGCLPMHEEEADDMQE